MIILKRIVGFSCFMSSSYGNVIIAHANLHTTNVMSCMAYGDFNSSIHT